MNKQEAIEVLKRNKPTSDPRRCGKELCEACDIAIKALEKQIPKKIEIWNGQASCPCCKKLFGNMSGIQNLIAWDMPHCKWCGQKSDWSVKE